MNFLRAARYLGVPPWELLAQSPAWVEWALMADEVDQKTRPGMRLF